MQHGYRREPARDFPNRCGGNVKDRTESGIQQQKVHFSGIKPSRQDQRCNICAASASTLETGQLILTGNSLLRQEVEFQARNAVKGRP